MTLGDLYPRLRELPGYEEIAGRPAESSPTVTRDAPGLVAMAGNFAGALAAHVVDGGRKAPAEVRAARESACESCPLHDAARDACTACGCGTIPALSFVGLDLALKRSWASSSCPDSPPRWGPV